MDAISKLRVHFFEKQQHAKQDKMGINGGGSRFLWATDASL
jgi:hypothetical protein